MFTSSIRVEGVKKCDLSVIVSVCSIVVGFIHNSVEILWDEREREVKENGPAALS